MTISGQYDDANWFGAVCVNGIPLSPSASLAHVMHSPDGFAWGYCGSGPSQLAFAILLEITGSPLLARTFYRQFTTEFVATWPRASFSVSIDIDVWLVHATLNKG